MKKVPLVLMVLSGLALLCLPACQKNFGVTPTAPSLPTAVPSGTPTLTPTSTGTVNPLGPPLPTGTPTLTPTPQWTPTSTPTFTDINMTSGVTVLSTGSYQFGCVHIGGSAVVTIQGAVTVFCTCFTLDAGATITGVGMGYISEEENSFSACNLGRTYGPGSGLIDYGNGTAGSWNTGGGGGHGGAGGTDCDLNCNCAAGGVTYDNPIHPTQMGSGGASPSASTCSPFSCGGGLLWIVVYNPTLNQVSPATVNGTIDMSGGWGCFDCGPNQESGSGGAGGGLLIEASTINGSGYLSANGGNDTFYGGGGSSGAGGGGGIISLIGNTTGFTGNLSVSGGAGAPNQGGSSCQAINENGSSGSQTITAAPTSGY
jgi:hypothetical protein